MLRAVLFTLLAAIPTSSNYVLQTYDFGSGAGSGSSSNYHLNGTAGQVSGNLSSASYKLPAAIQASSTVGVPPAPAFTNPDSSYDRLKIVINNGGAASDTKFAIAISDDNFTTTKYVKADQTIGTSFTVANYQTYAAWGGASGIFILSLANNTNYSVKVAALQGSHTGSAFGPVASASTSMPSVTFGLSTSLTGTPPFVSTFSSLASGSVTSANATITASITANAENGGQILVRSQNGGLVSSTAGYTLTSATTDLASAPKGYGAQISATSQASGGPVVSSSPFNGGGNNIGALSTSWQQLASFNSPIVNGSLTFGLLAKTDATVPSAPNYSDAVTLNISLLF